MRDGVPRAVPLLILAAVLALLAAVASPAAAQYGGQMSECSNLGRAGMTSEVRAVAVDDIISMPETYEGQAVRTSGDVEMDPTSSRGMRNTVYLMKGHVQSGAVVLGPSPEAAAMWEDDMRKAAGREVEVTGFVHQMSGQGGDQAQQYQTQGRNAYILVCGYVLPPDEKERRAKGAPATLEQLNAAPDRWRGRLVTVEGEFRGANLFGDMPPSTRGVRSDDWVIKDDVWSAWVTGLKPKGRGWSLDVGMKRDCGKWVRVTGRLRDGLGQTVVISATNVELVTARTRGMAVPAPAPTPPPRPARPRRSFQVSFTLPVDGERDVLPNQQVWIQFSADYDERSIEGRIVVRFAIARPGDRELITRLEVDLGRRAVHVDVGEMLPSGRVIDVVLLAGIVDMDGRPLERRPDAAVSPPEGVVDVVRFQVWAPR